MTQMQPTEKLHTACDECRTRKLKCSGETPTCTRCRREKICCVYSPQKQMGRPKKRRREDGAGHVTEPALKTPASSHAEHNVTLNEFHTLPNYTNFGLNSPPELQDFSNQGIGYQLLPHDFGYAETCDGITQLPAPELGLISPDDPALWYIKPAESQQQSDQGSSPDQAPFGPCTCLSLSYLTLTNLQSVPTFAFPQVIVPLRKAMDTITSLINCPVCPKEPFSAIQNLQSLVSLFKAIIERFHKVLDEVDAEAARLEQTGQKKPYRIGDNSPGLMHLHTGTADCPMGFNIDIEASDWKRLVKTALKTEMFGGGSNQRPVNLLLQEAEARQARWHGEKEFQCDQRTRMFGADQDKTKCIALGSEQIRMAMQNLEWN